MTKSLSVAEIEYIAFALARDLMEYNEPIPDFSTRFSNALESCLLAPFQKFGGKSLYQGVISKASALFYLMIKNHPFQNGNKRIAVTTLLIFLAKNKRWLKTSDQELYNFSVWIAESPAKLKKETIQAINHFLKDNIVSFKKK